MNAAAGQILTVHAVPTLAELTARYEFAQLTTALVMTDGKASGPPDVVNVYSALIFGDGSASDPGSLFVTKSPESVPGLPGSKLMVTRSTLCSADAATLLAPRDWFVDLGIPSGERLPVRCPGAWVGPVALDLFEARVRRCLPPIGEFAWLVEKRTRRGAHEPLLTAEADRYLCDRVKALLGVGLDDVRERLGGFLAVFPERRVRVAVRLRERVGRIGVDVQAVGAPEGLQLIVAARGHNEGIAEQAIPFPDGPVVFDFGSPIQGYEVSVLDRNGRLMHREGAGFLTQIVSRVGLVAVRGPIVVTDSSGAAVRLEVTWGSHHETFIGERSGWSTTELAERLESERRKLVEDKRLHFFEGGSQERERAVQAVRDILAQRMEGRLDIWDPYLDEADIYKFVVAVFDGSMPIRLLSAPDEAPAQADSTPPAAATRRAAKTARLRHGIQQVRVDGQGTPGLANLQAAVGTSRFHDRFLLTSGRCWQLGCSLNHIGKVVSSIVEFPYPAIVQASFDAAWAEATRGRVMSGGVWE